jgi:hypothetical protein
VVAPEDQDRRRWSRLILFTIVMVAILMAVLWWTGWFYAGLATEPRAWN